MIFGKKRIEGYRSIASSLSEINPISAKLGLQKFSDVEHGIGQDKFSLFVIIFSIFLIILQCVLIAVNWNKFPPEIPLFYSQPWGEKILAKPIYSLILPLIVLVFMVLNYWILLSNREDAFLKRTISVFTIMTAIFCTYSIIRLVALII